MRTIYVNPGESLEIRIIDDPEEPRTVGIWKNQFKPKRMFIKIEGEREED